MSAANDAVRLLRDALNAEWTERMGESRKNRRAKALATALFKAKHSYEDPDQPTMGGEGHHPAIVGNGAIGLYHPLQPAWVTYLRDAQLAIEALEQIDNES